MGYQLNEHIRQLYSSSLDFETVAVWTFETRPNFSPFHLLLSPQIKKNADKLVFKLPVFVTFIIYFK